MTIADRNAALDSLFDRVARHVGEGRTGDAEQLLKQAMNDTPTDPRLGYRLGCLYLHCQRTADAIDAFQSALRIQPGNPVILNELGYAMDQAGNAAGAEEAYALAAKAEPPYPLARYNHALRLIRDDALDAAQSLLESTVKQQPDFVPGLVALGKVLETRGDISGATQHYQRALSHEPTNDDALLGAGYAEMTQCLFESAVGKFEAYLVNHPADVNARLQLGCCLQELGHTDRALEVYRSILSQDSSHYYAVVKNLLSASRGVLWLKSDELRKKLLE